MKLIVGLGNPGRRYAETRHNLGYRTVDELAKRWGIDVGREKFSGIVGQGHHGGHDVLLLKPTTFMNRSGESVLAAGQFYKVPLSDTIVVVDDLDLPVGRIRVRPDGSSGGHKGLADIIRRLGDDGFARVRIGIGPAHRELTVEHVLSRATEEEAPVLEEAVVKAADAVSCWVRLGIQESMNRFNGPPGKSGSKDSGSASADATEA